MYYKTVQPSGRSFLDSDYQWIPKRGDPAGTIISCSPSDSPLGLYPYVSSAVANCIGMQWPCRLIELRPLTPVMPVAHPQMSTLFQAHKWQVVRELPAILAFGPQYPAVLDFFTRLARLSPTRLRGGALVAPAEVALERLRHEHGQAAQDEHRYAAWCAAITAAWKVCEIKLMSEESVDQIGQLAGALVVKDLIDHNADYLALKSAWDALTQPQEPPAPTAVPAVLTEPTAPVLAALS